MRKLVHDKESQLWRPYTSNPHCSQGTITQSDPPKRQRKQIALKNTDFLWT